MDFIEFLQNEEKYGREVIYKENEFKVGKTVRFSFYNNHIAEKMARKSVRTNYSLTEIMNQNGKTQWYIIKEGYFTGFYFEVENSIVHFKSKEITQDDIEAVTNNLAAQKKKQNKRAAISTSIMFVILILFIIFSIYMGLWTKLFEDLDSLFSSCNINISSTFVNGTYYKQISGNNLDKNTYIKLDNGKFVDKEKTISFEGTYEISDGEIKFYTGEGDKKILFLSGTIENGVIEILGSKFVKSSK